MPFPWEPSCEPTTGRQKNRVSDLGKRIADPKLPGFRRLSRRHDLPRRSAAIRSARLRGGRRAGRHERSEEHTSELQSLMRNSYAVFCLKKKKHTKSSY